MCIQLVNAPLTETAALSLRDVIENGWNTRPVTISVSVDDAEPVTTRIQIFKAFVTAHPIIAPVILIDSPESPIVSTTVSLNDEHYVPNVTVDDNAGTITIEDRFFWGMHLLKRVIVLQRS